MNNLQTLQDRVEKMLNGEKKRREVALKFADKVTEILKPGKKKLKRRTKK